MTGTETGVGHDSERTHLEVIKSLGISEEAAEEVASELGGDLGLVKDLTFGDKYYIVRWHDAE